MAPADDIGEQVLRFRDGDPAAAEALARRACRLALRTAAAMLGSREEAADVAQGVHGPGVFVPSTIGDGGGPTGPQPPHQPPARGARSVRLGSYVVRLGELSRGQTRHGQGAAEGRSGP